MEPQLLKDLGLSVPEMKRTLSHEDFCMQQKVDGQRLLIDCTKKVPTAYSRKGEKIYNCPAALKSYFGKYSIGMFDGEYIPITGMFWVFDYIEDTFVPYIERLQRLEEELTPAKTVRMLPTAFTLPDKVRLMRAVVRNQAEGVVFKDLQASYVPGARSGGYKYKLYNDADCVVMERHPTKQSVSIGMYDHNGELVEVGSVQAADQRAVPGAVLLVKYLYATDSATLYQPSLLQVRKDKTTEECTLDQLRYTCPEVLDESDILRLGS